MCKTLRVLVMTIFLMTPFSIQVFAIDIMEINQLIENAKELADKQVMVQGEAIGELMQRGEYSWVNINDSTNAIGIWMRTADAQQITYYGNYKNIGDTIMVIGVFHRACSEHGGEADIHCETLKIEKRGYPVKIQIPNVKIMIAVILFILFVVFFLIYYFTMQKNSSE